MTSKTVYLLDTENPGGGFWALNYVLRVKNKGDKVMVFCSHTTSPKVLNRVMPSKHFIWVENGKKDCMDIVIAATVGRLSAKHPSWRFVILSNDNGYDLLGDNVSRINSHDVEARLTTESKSRIQSAANRQNISNSHVIEDLLEVRQSAWESCGTSGFIDDKTRMKIVGELTGANK